MVSKLFAAQEPVDGLSQIYKVDFVVRNFQLVNQVDKYLHGPLDSPLLDLTCQEEPRPRTQPNSNKTMESVIQCLGQTEDDQRLL